MQDNGGQKLSKWILSLLSKCRKPSVLVVEAEILIEIILFSGTNAKQEQLIAKQFGATKPGWEYTVIQSIQIYLI